MFYPLSTINSNGKFSALVFLYGVYLPVKAFPTNSKMDKITPPKPVVMEEAEEQVEKTPPVFMLSGMSQAVRNLVFSVGIMRFFIYALLYN